MAAWSALLFREQRVSVAIARRAGARRAVARAAGVIRTPVVQTAGAAECDRVRDVVPMNARRAGVIACQRGAVMRVADRNERPAAEHAHAADRFAREIVRFLTVCVVRSRRLMGNPLAGRMWRGGMHQRWRLMQRQRAWRWCASGKAAGWCGQLTPRCSGTTRRALSGQRSVPLGAAGACHVTSHSTRRPLNSNPFGGICLSTLLRCP